MGVYAVLRTAATVYVLEEPSTSIGRDETCDLRLGGRGVSRVHAELVFVGPGGKDPTLTDLGSSNGTFVNGERLRAREPQLLRHGDHVHFSAYEKTSFRFELPDEEGAVGAPDPAPPQRQAPPLPPSRRQEYSEEASKEHASNAEAANIPPRRPVSVDRPSRDGVKPAVRSNMQGRSAPRPASADRPEDVGRGDRGTSGKEPRKSWRPRSASRDAAVRKSRDDSAQDATLAAVQKAVGHLEELFDRMQEASRNPFTAYEQRDSAIRESGLDTDARAEQLAALAQRAERLAAIHVPREMLRLQQAAIDACARREPSPVERSVHPLDDSTVQAGELNSELVQRKLEYSSVVDPSCVQDEQRSPRLVRAMLRTSATLYILEEQMTSIGRDEACDVRLQGRGVSRFHAEIVFGPGQGGVVRDLGSNNGTFVNSERLQRREARPLAHGDILHFSAYEKSSFRFELPGGADLGALGEDATLSPPAKASLFPDMQPTLGRHVSDSDEAAGEDTQAGSVLLDTQIPGRPRKNSSKQIDEPPGKIAQNGTPDFGPSPEGASPSEERAGSGPQLDISNAVPAVRRAVEQLEELFSKLPGVDDSAVDQRDASTSAPVAPGQNLPAGNATEQQLQNLVHRAERLAGMQLPAKDSEKNDARKKCDAPRTMQIECHTGRPEPDGVKAELESQLQEMSRPSLGGMAQGQDGASDVRRQLAAFEGMVPTDLDRVSRDKNGAESDVAADLRHWQDVVSGKDVLTREESSAVMGVLLRSERALAELERGETAAKRRWKAMTDEGRLIKERLRALENGVCKLRERRAGVDSATAEQRRKLWAELEAKVALCGQEDEKLAAHRVREELERLSRSVCDLQSNIAVLDDEAEQHTASSVKAERRCKLMEDLSSQNRARENAEQNSLGAQVSLDDIVELEVENERLQWQLYYAEKDARESMERQRSAEIQRKLLNCSGGSQPSLWTPACSSSSVPRALPQDECPTTGHGEAREQSHVMASDAAACVSVTPRLEEAIVAVESDHDRKSRAIREQPAVAELCKRLSLSRDERREVERGNAGDGNRGRSSSRSRRRPSCANDDVSDLHGLSTQQQVSSQVFDDIRNNAGARLCADSCRGDGDHSSIHSEDFSRIAIPRSSVEPCSATQIQPGGSWKPDRRLHDSGLTDAATAPPLSDPRASGDQCPSHFWGDEVGYEDDILGLSTCNASSLSRTPAVASNAAPWGNAVAPSRNAEAAASNAYPCRSVPFHDSLDRLFDQPTASVIEPLGFLPVGTADRDRRFQGGDRRPAAVAGSLAVSGQGRHPPVPTASAYPHSRSPSELWPTDRVPQSPVGAPLRPPAFRAVPKPPPLAGSPSACWGEQLSGARFPVSSSPDLPGDSLLWSAAPSPAGRSVPRPPLARSPEVGSERHAASLGRSDSAHTSDMRSENGTPAATFITQSVNGVVAPSGPGRPPYADRSGSAHLFGNSLASSADRNIPGGPVRSVKLDLDD